MYKHYLQFVIIVFGILFCSISISASKPAENFNLEQTHLAKDLSGLKGKVVYLDFWASWCKPCRKSFPWMHEMQAKYADKGLQIITVNLDSEQSLAAEFLRLTPSQLPIVYDPEGHIASAYQLVGMPSSYLIDRSGNVRQSHKGFFTKKQTLYEQEIISLLDEKE